MILRNIAVRLGRTAFTTSFKRALRPLSTATETISNPVQDGSPGIDAENPKQLNLTKRLRKKTNRRVDEGIVTQFKLSRAIKQTTGYLGSVLESHYEPGHVLSDPPRPEDVTLELLMASQSHMGHATSLWNPGNQRYIYGIRQGIHIISLEQTAAHLRRASKVVEGIAYCGGLILFVGTRPGQERCVIKAASLAKGCHLFQRWIPGSITNGNVILSRSPIKVVNEFDEEVRGYEQTINDMEVLKPDLVVCLNPLENYICLRECGSHNIPTIAIIDTDANPTWVTYPIPANDDSIRCVQLIAGVLGRAAEEGHRRRLEAAKRGIKTWKPPVGFGQPQREATGGFALA